MAEYSRREDSGSQDALRPLVSWQVKNNRLELLEQFKDCNFNAACGILSNVLGKILRLNGLHEDQQPFYYFE